MQVGHRCRAIRAPKIRAITIHVFRRCRRTARGETTEAHGVTPRTDVKSEHAGFEE
jgi:hypothetical protein